MRDSIYRISLDIHNKTPQVQIVARKGDRLRRIEATLTEHGKPWFVPRGGQAVVVIKGTGHLPDIVSDCEIYSDGTVAYDFTDLTVSTWGYHDCILMIYDKRKHPDEKRKELVSPRFTILVENETFDEGARTAGVELREAVEELQTAVSELQAAQAEDDETEKSLKEELEKVAKAAYDATDVDLVTAQYNFESDYIISVDKDENDWVLDGSKRFVLRLTDGSRTIDLMLMDGSKKVGDRWLLIGTRPTGMSGTMPYVIVNDTEQQPDYVYAPMGIDTAAHSPTNCMHTHELNDKKYLWISKLHVSASLAGIATDGHVTPAATTLALYDPTHTYNAGDKVIYASSVYVCKTDSTTGAWDGTKWDVVELVWTFLPLSETIVSASYPNIHALPVHTVSFINPSWFSYGITGLPTDDYYYVASTGQKASGYATQIALGSVNRRMLFSKWTPNAQASNGGTWSDWTPLADATLKMQGVPADAKSVGDILYGGSDHTHKTPHVLNYYSGVSGLESLDDMPAWSVIGDSGETWKPLLGESFPHLSEVSDSITYIMKKEEFGVSQRYCRYTFSSLGGIQCWIGYTTITDDTIRWGYSDDLSHIIYGDREKDTNVPKIMTRFKGVGTLTSLAGMPSFSYFTASGETILDLDDIAEDFQFQDEIVGLTTYRVEKTAIGASPNEAYLYTLSTISKSHVWCGYTFYGSQSPITWKRIISPTDTTLSLAGRPADAKSVGDLIQSGSNMVKILVFGNSFSYSDLGMLPAILKEMGISVTLGILYDSGQTPAGHISKFDQNEKYTYYSECDGTTWTNTYQAKSAKEALDLRKWDYVAIQMVRDPTRIDELTDLISGYVTYPVSYLIILSQARGANSNQLPHPTEEQAIREADSDAQFLQIANNAKAWRDGGYLDGDPQQAVKGNTILDVLPCGTAVQNARQIPTVNGVGFKGLGADGYLCYDDTSHLQNGIGTLIPAYAAALKICELMGAKQLGFGSAISPTDTWLNAYMLLTRPDAVAGLTHGASQGVNKANKLLAQKCALQAYKNPFVITEIE